MRRDLRVLIVAIADVGGTLRGATGFMAIVLLVLGLMVVSLASYHPLVVRAQLAELFFLPSSHRAEITVEYAQSGRWTHDGLDDSLFEAEDRDGVGRYIRDIALLPGGRLDVVFGTAAADGRIRDKVVTMRPALSSRHGQKVVVWVCGKYLPAGFHTELDNATTVPDVYLPRQCKER